MRSVFRTVPPPPGVHEVPRGHLVGFGHAGQHGVRLLGAKRHRAQPTLAIPGQHHSHAHPAEATVRVIQDRVRRHLWKAAPMDNARLWWQKWRWYERNSLPWNRFAIHRELARRRAFARWPIHGNVLE